MRVQDVIGNPVSIMLGVALARLVPRSIGYWLARHTARWIARHRFEVFRTLRENLSHVVPEADDATLDALAERTLYQTGCCYFDMLHFRPRDLEKILEYDPQEWAQAAAWFADERGTLVVGAHISNYDLAAQWFVSQGFEIQALSLASPSRGDRVVNALRRHRGLIATPISVSALREAVQRLRRGGIVITGVDRPVSEDDKPILFFDAPAPLPRGHVRLALQTGARIVVAYCLRKPDGHYRLHILPALDMEHVGTREEDIEHNTRRVLDLVETTIRAAPDQWIMLVPVWRTPLREGQTRARAS